jgi:hypothetical protein
MASCLMCLEFRNKFHVPARLSVERRQHEETSKDLSIVMQTGRVAGPAMNVQWTNYRVLKLIELYHGNECLWNGQQAEQMHGIASWKNWEHHETSSNRKCTAFAHS